MTSATTNDIDRKTASRLLKVSIRTIDRYIRSGRLVARAREGRVVLDRRDVEALPHHHMDINSHRITPDYSVDMGFYKELYQEAKHALDEYRGKLQEANFRLHHLETQVPTAYIPAAKITPNEHLSYEFSQKEVREKEKEILKLQEELSKERTGRIVLSVITYALLAALGVLWYFLQ